VISRRTTPGSAWTGSASLLRGHPTHAWETSKGNGGALGRPPRVPVSSVASWMLKRSVTGEIAPGDPGNLTQVTDDPPACFIAGMARP
jgi:hypothetical protein